MCAGGVSVCRWCECVPMVWVCAGGVGVCRWCECVPVVWVCAGGVRSCSSPLQALQKLSTSEVSPKGLRDMSDNVLLLVTTTIQHMEEVPGEIQYRSEARYNAFARETCLQQTCYSTRSRPASIRG